MISATSTGSARLGRLNDLSPSILLATLLLFGSSAPATEYFVSTDGHDQAPGTTAETALCTIQKAADRLAPGDTLTIAPGEYPQRFAVRRSGTAERPITVRAAIPGFTVIRGNDIITGFRKVDGMRFVWSASCNRPVYRVVERDTQAVCLEAPALTDMDQFRRSHLYDSRRKILYLHTSDGQPPDQHVVAATVIPAYGVEITGDYVHVDGLVIEGFFPTQMRDSGRGFGMSLTGHGHEIRRCTFLFNGGGITVNARECVIRDNLLIGNLSPGNGELAQIYCTKDSQRIRTLNNTVLNAETYGIRNYDHPADGEVCGNIVKDQHIGIDFKASQGKRVASHNVATDCSSFSWYSGTWSNDLQENHNTFQGLGFWDGNTLTRMGKNTLFRGTDQPDPRFADPAHLDYRLQADSPYRGKGPGGSDLGAYAFEPKVFFVRPDGDDSHDGLSMSRAFRSIHRAMAECRPGVTVYLAEGTYREPLRPGQSGDRPSPVVIRGRGATAKVEVASLDLTGLQYVHVENMNATGGAALGNSVGIKLERCGLMNAAGEAVTVRDSTDIWLRHLTVAAAKGAAIRVEGPCRDVRITSSILRSGDDAALKSDIGKAQGLFCEYNNYLSPPSVPLAVVGGTPAVDLARIPALTGSDRHSLSADPKFTGRGTPATIDPTSPCAGRGELRFNIGAGQIERAPNEPQITEVQLRDVTPTTASLTWWTPNTSNATWRPPLDWYDNHPIHSEVHYGTSSAYGNRVYSFGDLYHRVTLPNLEPGSTYYFKIVIPDRPWCDSLTRNYMAMGPRPGWRGAESQAFAFTTPPVAEWKPARLTFYVAPTGNEANPGLDANAPTTLTAASDRVRAGDTVVMLDGVYQEMFAPASSGIAEAPITLKARSPGRACMDGSAFLRPSAVALLGKDHVIIDGVVIRRFADRGYGTRAGLFSSQVFLARCGEVTLQNCVFAGWGIGYGKGVVARGGDRITVRNCVVTGFAHAVNARQSREFNLIGNTWYVPLIDSFDLDGRVVVKNNLFYGQEPQKVAAGAPMVSPKRPTESDYNAFYFGPGNNTRHVGYGLPRRSTGDTGGLRRIQQELGLDLHSTEAAVEDVRLPGPAPTNYMDSTLLSQFANRVKSGDLIPTVEMFRIPPASRLNRSGENGHPIGARPPDNILGP